MKNRYRAVGLWVLLGLAGAGRAAGQPATSPGRQDTLKGKIWTATARRIWADAKPRQPLPAPWATGTAFGNWALTTPADPSEIGLLRRDVIARIGKGQPGYPAEVASAILAIISEKRQAKKGALARVDVAALQASLVPFIPVGSTAPRPVVAGDSDANDFVLAKPSAAAPVTAKNPQSAPNSSLPQSPAIDDLQLSEPRYWGLSPALAGGTLALLGALLGAGITYSQLKNRHRRRRHHSAPVAAEPAISSIMNSLEYRKLKKQNENLSAKINRLTQQVAELHKQLSAAPSAVAGEAATPPTTPPSATTPPPAAAAPPMAEELTIEEMVGALPAPPLPTATRYGPVQETPFVEERKIVDAPLPQLALMLTVNPRNSDQATFTLNPNVDQARLIGDGLTRLQKFFDYDPPLGGRITAVAAAAAGQLQRHADGWQVVQRARLTIS